MQYLYSLNDRLHAVHVMYFLKPSAIIFGIPCVPEGWKWLISDRQKAMLRLKGKNECTGGGGLRPRCCFASVTGTLPACLPHVCGVTSSVLSSAVKCRLLPPLSVRFFLGDSPKLGHVRLWDSNLLVDAEISYYKEPCKKRYIIPSSLCLSARVATRHLWVGESDLRSALGL